MATRIRSVKPELRTSERVASWPIPLRYFWVLLWGYVDDYGRGRDNARLIRADAFPLDDDVTVATIEEWVEILVAERVVDRYEVDGTRYLFITNWAEHQRVDRPTKQRIPCPHGLLDGSCADGHKVSDEGVPAPSGNPRDTLASHSMLEGDGEGEEEGEGEVSTTPPPLGCPKHPNNTTEACGPCRRARLAYEAWEASRPAAAPPRSPRPPTAMEAKSQDCQTHPGWPRRDCPRCADDAQREIELLAESALASVP